MITMQGCHPWEEWFCRVLDKDWTPSGSPYYYRLTFDKNRNPANLMGFYKESHTLHWYIGTFRILYRTERAGDHYLIMERIPNQEFEDIKYIGDGDKRLIGEVGDRFIARYYPTGWERIELMPADEKTAESIVREYFDEQSR